MTAGAAAVASGAKLVDCVTSLAEGLGLAARSQFRLGRRFWGAERIIDLLLTQPQTRERIGIECKFQGSRGSAEEKVVTTLQDIDFWPMRGVVVLDGEGFSDDMRKYVIGTGKSVALEDLDVWLRLFFKLELPEKV